MYLVAAVQQSLSQQEKNLSINNAQCWALTSLVYSLMLAFYFWQLQLRFKYQRSGAHLMNKTCTFHENVFATELIFCNDPKSNRKKVSQPGS